ncbi:MAG: cell division protein FtsA [Hyphomicrobiaceae bacterium]|nr:cell division protein FtsA [Hyphomicrobiaceae bacterium]
MLARSREHRPEVLGVIDIGSSKITCIISERTTPADGAAGPQFRVLGVGFQRSRGVKAGFVIDLDQAEAAVRLAVADAERMAGVTLEDVVVNVSCGRVKSMHFYAHAELQAGHVRPEDLNKLREGAYSYAERGGRAVVHLNRIGYLLDGDAGVRQPLRMAGRKLSAQYHAVTVDETPLENLLLLLERCYLGVGELLPSGYISGVAATTEEERRFGVIVADIGEGGTDLAMFADGRFLYADMVPVGSGHITFDIARILSTTLAEAERIKTLYGSMITAGSDERQVLSFSRSNGHEGEQGQTTKAELRRIIAPRVLGHLALLRDRIAASELLKNSEASVVLTGGGSLMMGLPAAAAELLGRKVRVGHTRIPAGVPERLTSPAFATAVGMISAASGQAPRLGQSPAEGRAEVNSGSFYRRMRTWLSESF